MSELTRAELMERICPTDATYDCCQGECSTNCENCEDVLNYFLDRYDETLRADERAKMLMPYDVESIDELIENVRAKVIDEALEDVAFEEKWLDSAIWADKGNYRYNIDIAFKGIKSSLRKLKEQKNDKS